MIAFCGPVIAELGWEIITLQSYFRALSKHFDKTYVCSFPDSRFLYDDFCHEFIPHLHPTRALNWWDKENIEGVRYNVPDDVTHCVKPVREYRNNSRKFIKYGVRAPISTYDYLIHPRHISKGAAKNYTIELWDRIIAGLHKRGALVASIGKDPDWHIEGTDDLRGIDGDLLTRYMAGCKCVIGGSSGVMHLATLCLAPIVVWGDSRTYFNETLERRYSITWNPFGSPVRFIFDDDWKPDPERVLEAVSTYAR
jgi:ADP-heptose:LPS heptosyltransferase